jgi:hypothetical protein
MDATSAAVVPFAQRDAIDMIIAGIHPGLISLSPENNTTTRMGWAPLLYELPYAVRRMRWG